MGEEKVNTPLGDLNTIKVQNTKPDDVRKLIFWCAPELKYLPVKIEHTEKVIKNIASNFSFKIDLQVISKESAYEMFSKREQINILNESLNKHLIVFGGENYYKILSNARK